MLVDDDVRELLDTLTPQRPVTDRWAAIAAEAHRPRRHRVRTVVIASAAAAVVGVLVVGPARGLREDALRLLGGADAPAPVQEAVAPIAGYGPVHAYVELRTSVGARATLFSMTSGRGERCLGVAWSAMPRPRAGATCGQNQSPRPLHVTESGTRIGGSWVALLFGNVGPDVERLVLVSTSGAAVEVPMSASHFLVEVPRWAGEAQLVAYGFGGLILARHELETSPSWTPPDPLGEATPVLIRKLGNRTWTVESYAASDARRCYGISTTGGSAFRCVAESEIAGRQLSVLGPDRWPSVDGSGSWTTVVGAVGDDVARVEITLANGMRRETILRKGTFVYFAPGDTPAERPVRVAAFNRAGTVLAAEPLR